MKPFLLLLILTIPGGPCLAQKPWPYKPGVSENCTGTIRSTDPSAFEGIAYVGQQEKTVFDRRAKDGKGGRIAIQAHVFNIAWSDGLSSELVANPEIGDFAAVTAQAERHAKIVGLLPHCLRALVDQIVLHGGNATMGGGNRGILIYSERTMQHETQKGKLHEIMVHEAAHNLGQIMQKSPEWLAAQRSDNAFISKYAQDFPLREDVSESFLAWLILRYHRDRITEEQANTISSQIPARLKYFDERNYNLFPVMPSSAGKGPKD
ncbi:MAG TPA: hypothetical protein PLA50_09015 [Bacteroidia bacterium]|nr:hypothetical protein [Bacteroidia bacterium]